MNFKYAELFAGVLGFGTALDELGGDPVFISEIDRFAQQAIRALGKGEALHGDITKIEAAAVPDHDLLVGGFPCQAFSVAGKRLGYADMRGTLFFEVVRIAKEKKPRAILLENVKGLLGHAKGDTISTMLHALNDIGYVVDMNILNSKFFNVPQHRERVFILALREDLAKPAEWHDIKGGSVLQKAKRRLQDEGLSTFNFEWPQQKGVTKKLADVLENEVDESYYLSKEKTAMLVARLESTTGEKIEAGDNGQCLQRSQSGVHKKPLYGTLRAGASRTDFAAIEMENPPAMPSILDTRQKSADTKSGKSGIRLSSEVCPTLTATEQKDIKKVIVENKPLMVGSLDHYKNDQMNRVYSPDGVSPTITVVSGGGREKKIAEEVRPCLTPFREEKRQNGPRFKPDGAEAHTITAQDRHGVAMGSYPKYRIRKLTPRECWRLQGFSDEAFDKVRAAGISNSQLYKQAGNAVTVSTVRAIAEKLLPYLH